MKNHRKNYLIEKNVAFQNLVMRELDIVILEMFRAKVFILFIVLEHIKFPNDNEKMLKHSSIFLCAKIVSTTLICLNALLFVN